MQLMLLISTTNWGTLYVSEGTECEVLMNTKPRSQALVGGAYRFFLLLQEPGNKANITDISGVLS